MHTYQIFVDMHDFHIEGHGAHQSFALCGTCDCIPQDEGHAVFTTFN